MRSWVCSTRSPTLNNVVPSRGADEVLCFLVPVVVGADVISSFEASL